jgi:hypothetical protein
MISEPSIKVCSSVREAEIDRDRQRQGQRPFRGGERERETCILFSALEKLFKSLQEAVFDATANTTVGQFHPLLH